MAYLRVYLLISFIIESGGVFTNSTDYERRRERVLQGNSRPSLAYPSSLFVLFISMTLLVGIFIRTLMLWSTHWIPYRVVMFAVGGLAGFCANKYITFRPIVNACYTDVDTLMLIFFPLLVFNISYNVDFHSFWRTMPQILLVGIPGSLLCALMMSFMAYYLIEASWNFSLSFLFGIVCTSIYPMEMVQELKTMSKGKYLSVLLLGEGLIGDVTVMIAFNLVFAYTAMAVTSAAQISMFLLRYAGGGLIFGLLMGKITSTLLGLTYNDSLCAVTISISFAYLSYYIGEKFLYVSGLLSVVIVGVMTSKKKSSLAVDVELMLLNFWAILAHVANTLLFTMAGVVVFDKLSVLFTARQVSTIFVSYASINVNRLIMYAVMMPLLKRMGYGMTWYHCMACVWGGLKGPISLCLALIILETPAITDTGDTFVVQTAGVVALSLLINATLINKVLKVLGLGEISLAKKANMTNCVKRIMSTRDGCIAMLKMDKFLADANWDMVHEGTTIKHPYKIQISNRGDDDDDENYMGYRYTTCPDCEREIPNEPTKKEFAEMLREAHQRVFKAMKISYWRQYEHGKISKDGVKILVQAVDVAADTDQGRINIEALATLWKPKAYAVWLRNHMVQMLSTKAANAQVPYQPCRQNCYRVVHSIWFDGFIYFMILLNTPVILCEVCMRRTFAPWVTNIIKGLNVFFYTIYFLEMVIKMIALGVGGYFKSHWNQLDFFIVLMATGDLALDILDSVSNWDKWQSVNTSLVTATKLLRMLRFLRLFRLARVSVPKMMAYLDRLIDIQLAFGYDVGKGFVTGEQEVCNLLPLLVDNTRIQDMLSAGLESDRNLPIVFRTDCIFLCEFLSLAVTRQLGLLQRDRPWTAITVKTKQATTSTLNIMLLDAAALKEEGFLDETEYRLLVTAIQEKLQLCRHRGNLIAPSSPETQLRSVSWLQSHERIADYLLENSEIYNYNYGDVLLSRGDEPNGLYVLVSGLLEAVYDPPDAELDEAIPNYDFFTDLKFKDSCQDYIVSGNAVGVLGVLTNRPYNYTVRCESAVQAYYIQLQVIQEAFKLAPHPIMGLKANMWREIGIKLAIVILPTIPAYHAWTVERLSLRLEHAFVPCLKAFKVFVVNDMMEDIILLDGVCQDMATKEIFKPPCYIPRTAHRLVFPKSSQIVVSPTCPVTKLLIVPSKDAEQHDIMEEEVDDGQCELISNVSSRCLYHQVVRKYSAETWNPARRGRVKRRRGVKRVNIQKQTSSSYLGAIQSERNLNEKFYKTLDVSNQSLGLRNISYNKFDK